MAGTEALLALKVVAEIAEKLAHDLEHGKLWEGELSQGIQEIKRQLQDAERAAQNDR